MAKPLAPSQVADSVTFHRCAATPTVCIHDAEFDTMAANQKRRKSRLRITSRIPDCGVMVEPASAVRLVLSLTVTLPLAGSCDMRPSPMPGQNSCFDQALPRACCRSPARNIVPVRVVLVMERPNDMGEPWESKNASA
ncbi:unannotated protein [freshwater metagenome]|uniref:Unannotated protein n=1 Tax=freshwater metagenome TaxID=449393 RepID=A0A6J7Q9S2_9ZZZZ